MKTKRNTLVALACLCLLLLFAALVLPALAPPSNCGGNSYALTACKQLGLYARMANPTNSSTLDLTLLDTLDRTNIFRIVDSPWTTGADYWVRTNGLGGSAQKRILVVCDTAYDNVPQPTIWNLYHRNPAHAVGFSDGTTGLISPAEFTGMDRSDFAALSDLGKPSQP